MKEVLKQFILKNKKAILAVASAFAFPIVAGLVGMTSPEFKAAVCGLPEVKVEEAAPVVGPVEAPKAEEKK